MFENASSHPDLKTSDWFALAARTALIVALTNIVHEFGHAAAMKALGYKVFMNINSAGPIPNVFRSTADSLIVDASGPLTTIAVAGIALGVTLRRSSPIAMTVILCALAMRSLAAVASFFLPNDEARISLAFGLGYWTLHLTSIGLILAMFIVAYRRQPVQWRWFATSLPVVVVTAFVIIASEQLLLPLVF